MDKIFEARQKSSKSLKIFTLEDLGYTILNYVLAYKLRIII